jgi:hypothetical protein
VFPVRYGMNSAFYMYHKIQRTKTLHSAHRVCLCVPYGSHNKQLRTGNRSSIPVQAKGINSPAELPYRLWALPTFQKWVPEVKWPARRHSD